MQPEQVDVSAVHVELPLVEQSEMSLVECVRQMLGQLLYADDPVATHDCELPHQELPYIDRQPEQVDVVGDAHAAIPLVEQSEEELVRQMLVQLLYADDPYVTHDCELPHQVLPYAMQPEQVVDSAVHVELPLVEQSEETLVRQPIVQLSYADDPYVTHDCELPHQVLLSAVQVAQV